MDHALFFEDIEIGAMWNSPGRTVTESDVINFASQTGDFNPLHVDFEFASKSIYRRPIAHGLLGVSWAAGLGSNYPRVNTVAFTAVRDWEFIKPIYIGDTVRLETTVLDKDDGGRRSGKVAWLLKLYNQRDEIVQQGVFETIVATSKLPRRNLEAPRESNGMITAGEQEKIYHENNGR
ncbi:MAG: MaoC/PaaZ C-terminal domain-containing protein [Pirellulaceae bacterium]